MEQRVLGRDLKVSALGLGCMGFSHAYGAPTDRTEAIRLIQQAADMGYAFFDTAEVYGTADDPHHNEELVGAALRSRREQVAGVMADLIREGKITHWGLSEAMEDTIRRAHAVCPVTEIQNRYSMMARWYESLFPVLEELGIGYVAFSPLANGLLSARYGKETKFEAGTDYRSVMPQFTPEGMEQNRALLELLHRLAEEKQATPAQISLAWMQRKKPYIVPIPGTRKLERMRENAGSADTVLTASEVQALDNALDTMEMSQVFGGTKIVKQEVSHHEKNETYLGAAFNRSHDPLPAGRVCQHPRQ